jgi:hypothetical protein
MTGGFSVKIFSAKQTAFQMAGVQTKAIIYVDGALPWFFFVFLSNPFSLVTMSHHTAYSMSALCVTG